MVFLIEDWFCENFLSCTLLTNNVVLSNCFFNWRLVLWEFFVMHFIDEWITWRLVVWFYFITKLDICVLIFHFVCHRNAFWLVQAAKPLAALHVPCCRCLLTMSWRNYWTGRARVRRTRFLSRATNWEELSVVSVSIDNWLTIVDWFNISLFASAIILTQCNIIFQSSVRSFQRQLKWLRKMQLTAKSLTLSGVGCLGRKIGRADAVIAGNGKIWMRVLRQVRPIVIRRRTCSLRNPRIPPRNHRNPVRIKQKNDIFLIVH